MNVLLQKKSWPCIGAKCAFSEEDEITMLDADTKYPLWSPSTCVISLTVVTVMENSKFVVTGNFYRKVGPLSTF